MPIFVFAHPLGVPYTGSPTTSAGHYPAQLEQLLPPGVVFDLEEGNSLRKLFQAIGEELERVRLRILDLPEESDPRTATETLEDWERILGLPDVNIPVLPVSPEGRRIAITQKFIARGGQSFSFFSTLIAAAGWNLVSVTNYTANVLRAGFRAGDRCWGTTFAYASLFTIAGPLEPGALTITQVRAIITAAVHPHITPIITTI